jgi:hypothetical protein
MAERVHGGASPAVSLDTLEATLGKAMQFLAVASTRPTVRAALQKYGYTQAEHRRAWQLIEAVRGREVDEAAVDQPTLDALTELDNWDEPNLRILFAALTRHPAVRAKVLDGLEAASGPGAVLNVAKILERLDAIEGTPEGDAALETLAARRLDKKERKRLAALVKQARSAPDVSALSINVSPEDYQAALLELRDWYFEWSEIARQVITRREHLIRMGLAERRNKDATEETDELEVTDPTPFIDPDAPLPNPAKG